MISERRCYGDKERVSEQRRFENNELLTGRQRFGDCGGNDVPSYLKAFGGNNSEAMKVEKSNSIVQDLINKKSLEMHDGVELPNYCVSKEISREQREEELISQESIPKKNIGIKKLSLDSMANAIKEKVTLIRHDGNLYYFTGMSYKMIKNSEDLLRITRNYVSQDAFGVSSIQRTFSELMIYLRNDDHLIPYNYEERIKKSQYYISFRNGVLDIRTLKLYKHIKDRLVFYELDAEWMETAVPMQFESFLQTASRENTDIRKRILETLGYLLAPINEGKYFFVMGTAPNSGKSTLGEILERFIGKSYVAHLSTEQVGGRFALGDIHGKTLNLSMDLPKGKLSAAVVSILKQITGGDTITTERKYDSLRDVHSNMRFLFASNYPVTIPKADNDDAFWDRMIVVPFKYSLAKEDVDVHFVDKLVAEKDEIISVCLNALSKLLRRNFVFSSCEAAEEMKRKWRNLEHEASQSILQFINECVVITGQPSDRVYTQKIYQAYSDYCDRHELESVSKLKLIEWLKNNLPSCKHRRLHDTGKNPLSGFEGMFLKKSTID